MGIENEYEYNEIPPNNMPFLGMKTQKNKLHISSLEEISNASFDHVNYDSYEENISKYKTHLDELEEFVLNQGETLGLHWKVQTTCKNIYFISLERKILNSMMCIA